MIILDKPYVSQLMQETLEKFGFPVLKNTESQNLKGSGALNLIEELDFIEKIKTDSNVFLYSNSENSINWISKNLSFTNIPEKINLFKDKFKFRELIRPLYPDFFYQSVLFSELESIDISHCKFPFIIKPAVGFFSLGVYKVKSIQEWPNTIASIKKEMNETNHLYPNSVVDSAKFIIEQNISGVEFAIDAYFDTNGKPVILNILEHKFPNEDDLNDRAYITSKYIIESYHTHFEYLLTKIGALAKLQNFPMHIEVRIEENGTIIPIEVNPMRFTGWCLTDIAYFSYGINVYDYYINQKKPDWDEILKDKDGKIYSLIIATLPKDIKSNQVKKIDYNKLSSYFENTLELRKIDYSVYPVFAFLFTETKEENWQEIDYILNSDLKEFIDFSVV